MTDSGPLDQRLQCLEQDIKRLEEELRTARDLADAANGAKDELLANVSHEIRTPMNAILGMTELALDAAESTHQRQLLATVKIAARDLLQIINDLLDFSKITTGKLELDVADFSLRAMIGETARSLAVRAHRKGLELVCNVHQDLPDLYAGDAGRIRQVLMNLIGNAIKFTARGEVVLEVSRDPEAIDAPTGTALRFVVRDTGIGIASEKHASIFRAFEQEDASTTRKFGGTGLGLAISTRLAALMGGQISLASELGRGSTFTFAVRLHSSERAGATASLSPGLDDLAVLIVDDNELDRQLLLEWLGNWRMRATAVADSTAALEALDRTPYALVLLAGTMPDVDGVTLAVAIRARFGSATPKLILLASEDRPELTAQSHAAGVDAYLLKPTQQSALLETIWAVMNTPADARYAVTKRASALHILVAEDNELNVAVLLELLVPRGHRVEVAGDGQVALQHALRTGASYDAMLLDLHMPELDGFEVVKAIREHERATAHHLPIIALTARSSKRDRERALDAGMDDFLSKPIQAEALWAALESASRLRR